MYRLRTTVSAGKRSIPSSRPHSGFHVHTGVGVPEDDSNRRERVQSVARNAINSSCRAAVNRSNSRRAAAASPPCHRIAPRISVARPS